LGGGAVDLLTKLHLINFRRHVDTELIFDEDKTFNVIMGSNGAGKSSLIEALLFGLYGETRAKRAGHRKANLNDLIRRGAELEGMSVEVGFRLDDIEYSVLRRRENNVSSAILLANDTPIMEGANQVSAEVTKILGLDIVGFRLSVVAEQKELDGLAALSPSERNQTLTRLLRLDTITRAKKKASQEYAKRRDALKVLAGTVDVSEIEYEIARLEEALSAQRRAVLETEGAIAKIELKKQDLMPLIESLLAKERLIEIKNDMKDSLSSKIHTAQNRFSHIVVPEEIVIDLDEESLAVQLREVSEESTLLREQLRNQAQNDSLIKKRDEEEAHLLVLEDKREALRVALAELPEVLGPQLKSQLLALEGKREELTVSLGGVYGEVSRLEEAWERADSLGVVCGECGQTISGEYRETHKKELKKQLDGAKRLLAKQTKALKSVNVDLMTLKAALEEEERNERKRVQLTHELASLSDQINNLIQSLDMLREIRIQQPVDPARLIYLQARQAELEEALRLVRVQRKAAAARAEALIRQEEAKSTLSVLEKELEAVYADLAEIEITAEERQANLDLLALEESYRGENALLRDLREKIQYGQGTLLAKQQSLKDARQALARKEAISVAAIEYANAEKLLNSLNQSLSTQVKPALEEAASRVLGILSDDRFNSVRFDDDYLVKVQEDNDFRDLAEFSGGEIDLISLAVRLALGEIVSQRYGQGGVGFIILDECFGSQDKERRETIKEGLRRLSLSYGQVFIVSHIEGLEEDADSILEVENYLDDNGNRVASVIVR
jgi:exonuclease SbcC